MIIFNSASRKIQDWLTLEENKFELCGLDFEKWCMFFCGEKDRLSPWLKGNQLFLFESDEKAEAAYGKFIAHGFSHLDALFYPGLEVNPYLSASSSSINQLDRIAALHSLHTDPRPSVIFSSLGAAFLKTFPASLFQEYLFKIQVSDIISPEELAKSLIGLGYISTSSVEEPGQFVKKGEVFDIYSVCGKAYRLHYFDDMIEEIFEIDINTQRTLRSHALEEVSLPFAPLLIAKKKFLNNFRNNIPQFGPSEKLKAKRRSEILNTLQDGNLFEDHVKFTPLFFENPSTLFDQFVELNSFSVSFDPLSSSQHFDSSLDEMQSAFELELEQEESDMLLPSPASLFQVDYEEKLRTHRTIFIKEFQVSQDFSSDITHNLDIKTDSLFNFLSSTYQTDIKPQFARLLLATIKKQFEYSGKILLTYTNDNSKKEFENLFEVSELAPEVRERVEFLRTPLESGFFYESEKVLVISENDLFAPKKVKVSNEVSNLDLFAEQISSLKEGDFVIHATHGIGKYLGLKTMNMGSALGDFLEIEYQSKDKVFVPVYKIDKIQKHADGNSTTSVDSLRSNKFQLLKQKARNSAKKLAFDLLKLQAERASAKAFPFSPPDDDFKEFEKHFPFKETPDQLTAIESIIKKMQLERPMDFLVCGDVGFGKTEIAMRAAYKAVQDKKQVAVLVPTTILALQHYNSFLSRFKNFAVNIASLSRFKSARESRETIEDLEEGKVDIIVGTHKLLNEKIKYKDLGLVIVDEEHRFGVGHKEKLKLLKSSVDFLTLTATPIPRTLQLAFLGLRDLSLIRTPPPKRQSIKSYLIKDDNLTIKKSIENELARGGQVYIVHNKVQDIEMFAGRIRELVPKAKIVFAHGQLPEKELETRIKHFYEGKYQILISTTIIESGIDIPNANTMIIDRADTFGLAQLHQLRGRIGRSDKKAYCYFVIPKFGKVSDISSKRLKALQTYNEIGSGFQIANCDLEIRGAGNILGANQSGHIESVGLELYTELLKEAISELNGEKRVIKSDIEIGTPFPAYIPNHYIDDSSIRLKYYKKLSACLNHDELEEYQAELYDLYGTYPPELKNLFTTLSIKIDLQYCGIRSLQISNRTIIIKFSKDELEANPELQNNVANYFLTKPKKFQFTPDYKVIYNHPEVIDQNFLLKFSHELAADLLSSLT